MNLERLPCSLFQFRKEHFAIFFFFLVGNVRNVLRLVMNTHSRWADDGA